MTGKLMMGYQGWFASAGDGSANNRWVHWFANNTPDAANATFDFWPDTSELDADELFATGLTALAPDDMVAVLVKDSQPLVQTLAVVKELP